VRSSRPSAQLRLSCRLAHEAWLLGGWLEAETGEGSDSPAGGWCGFHGSPGCAIALFSAVGSLCCSLRPAARG
jgi:hypothetical protein